MPKVSDDGQDKVSLEDLLRIKRAERPDEAFWNRFDKELHERTLQALVKKDPWFVQLLRGLSGKMAQTTAIGAVAAVLAMMVVQPAFFASSESGGGAADVAVATGELIESNQGGAGFDAALYEGADYGIEVYAADSLDGSAGVTREFSMDQIEVATYDREAYSADVPFAGFAAAGVASLVY